MISESAMQVEDAAIPSSRPRDHVLPGFDGVPRGELNQKFVNGGYKGDINQYYTLWDNDGLPHEKKFTCIFTCPLSSSFCPHQDSQGLPGDSFQ